MADWRKCDRCGRIGPAKEFQKLDVMEYDRSEPGSSDHATWVGREIHEITPDLVDLCGPCRRDLHDFFQNVNVKRRQA